MTNHVFYRGARHDSAIDWSDPEQAALQAKMDIYRNLIACNPMSYSEKDEVVRMQLVDQARRIEASRSSGAKEAKKNWDI